jgi:NAD(P)-dependent dehydrogenase (short-subunit alcohol dehydrogenase family)
MTVNVTYDFSGQVAVITGAARGVGRALVESFAAAGAHVVAADRDEPGLAQTCAPYGDAVLAVTADVSTEDGAARIIDGAAGRFGTLSICVNNAAVAPHTSLLDETVQVWDTVYAVNCRGTFLMTQLRDRDRLPRGRRGRRRHAGRCPGHRRRRPLRLRHRPPADLTWPGLAATWSR